MSSESSASLFWRGSYKEIKHFCFTAESEPRPIASHIGMVLSSDRISYAIQKSLIKELESTQAGQDALTACKIPLSYSNHKRVDDLIRCSRYW